MNERGWLPTEPEIKAAIAKQRAERIRMAQRVDDGPQTILVPRRPVEKSAPDEKDPPWVASAARVVLMGLFICAGLSMAALIGLLSRGNG
jgi:hypothetical protein